MESNGNPLYPEPVMEIQKIVKYWTWKNLALSGFQRLKRRDDNYPSRHHNRIRRSVLDHFHSA